MKLNVKRSKLWRGSVWMLRVLGLGMVLVAGSYVWSRVRAEVNAVKEFVVEVESVDGDLDALRVGCYNIAHGRGSVAGASNRRADGKAALLAHLKKIGEVIKAEGLDVVVLNEVDFSSTWSWNVNQTRVIAEAAGLPFAMEQRNFDLSFLFYELRFGNALLSRYPIEETRIVDLPAFKSHEAIFAGKKQGSSCVVVTPGGKVRVLPVHLEYRDEATAQASMNVLNGVAGGDAGMPVLVLGDFNTENVFAGSEALTVSSGKILSYPSESPQEGIDWIFGNEKVGISEVRLFGGGLSDHLGVAAKLVLEK